MVHAWTIGQAIELPNNSESVYLLARSAAPCQGAAG
jgi:hypothetical protein